MTLKAYAPSTAAAAEWGFMLVALCTVCTTTGRADSPPAAAPATLLQTYCGGCHQSSTPEQYARISDIRKTPEGWLMTIVRMQHSHGLQLTEEDRDLLVRYLADTQGLAPAEAALARFALERRPNVQDLPLPADAQVNLQEMCARCHSSARIRLQRRDAAEWLKLVNWHVAQFPTLEYQDKARDRTWLQIATTVVPSELGKLFPLQSQAWDDWAKKTAADLSGTWRVRVHEPGRGNYWGTAEVQRTAANEYKAVYTFDNDAGEHCAGESAAIVYTGYEWRGSGRLANRETREVFALSEDGQTLSGRWFVPAHPEDGGDWVATRATETPRIVMVSPLATRFGSTSRVTIFGDHLAGPVTFGAGIKVKVISRTPNVILADVTATSSAKAGYVPISVSGTSAANLFAVYNRVDRLDVTPHFGIARLGGGKLDPVSAQFEAAAYLDLPGAKGRTTPVRLGNVPVSWSAEPYNDAARVAQDVKYAGRIDHTGKFSPAPAGLNTERKFSGNNTGDLSVVATLTNNSGKPAVGKAHLIVTVQRWNTPPIY
jgi:quinohemoprotein amine dehydrogenase